MKPSAAFTSCDLSQRQRNEVDVVDSKVAWLQYMGYYQAGEAMTQDIQPWSRKTHITNHGNIIDIFKIPYVEISNDPIKL